MLDISTPSARYMKKKTPNDFLRNIRQHGWLLFSIKCNFHSSFLFHFLTFFICFMNENHDALLLLDADTMDGIDPISSENPIVWRCYECAWFFDFYFYLLVYRVHFAIDTIDPFNLISTYAIHDSVGQKFQRRKTNEKNRYNFAIVALDFFLENHLSFDGIRLPVHCRLYTVLCALECQKRTMIFPFIHLLSVSKKTFHFHSSIFNVSLFTSGTRKFAKNNKQKKQKFKQFTLNEIITKNKMILK